MSSQSQSGSAPGGTEYSSEDRVRIFHHWAVNELKSVATPSASTIKAVENLSYALLAVIEGEFDSTGTERLRDTFRAFGRCHYWSFVLEASESSPDSYFFRYKTETRRQIETIGVVLSGPSSSRYRDAAMECSTGIQADELFRSRILMAMPYIVNIQDTSKLSLETIRDAFGNRSTDAEALVTSCKELVETMRHYYYNRQAPPGAQLLRNVTRCAGSLRDAVCMEPASNTATSVVEGQSSAASSTRKNLDQWVHSAQFLAKYASTLYTSQALQTAIGSQSNDPNDWVNAFAGMSLN